MFAVFVLLAQSTTGDVSDLPAGEDALGTKKYDQYEGPQACAACHVDFYQQWTQAMMSQAYTHHWDEIEYFELAVPHAEKDEVVAGVKAGCNGCHAPLSFLAGDVPPPRPAENSRANESVSCDVCHTIVGYKGDTPYNFNYISNPGNPKYGPKAGLESPYHEIEKLDFMSTAEFCGTCHNEMSPYGVWVKATQLEWKEGPSSKQGVPCHQCHMPRATAKKTPRKAIPIPHRINCGKVKRGCPCSFRINSSAGIEAVSPAAEAIVPADDPAVAVMRFSLLV